MTEECAYCGEEFETEHERGVHISKEHVNPDTEITKSKRQHDPRKNIVDEWEGGSA